MSYIKLFLLVVILVLLPLMSFSLGCKDNRTLFERYQNGLDTLSTAGETQLWDLSVTKDRDTVTVLETFYNSDDIYIGFLLDGAEIINHNPAFLFYHDGIPISAGTGGSILGGDIGKTWKQYFVLSPRFVSPLKASDLPDEFILHFVVLEQDVLKRTFEFDIPLKRSDAKVSIDY